MLPKIIPALIFWTIFAWVVLQVSYPDNLAQANAVQIGAFFIPLFLAISLSINIFYKNILTSSSFSLGIVLMLVLKALDSLNLVTTLIILVAIYLLVSYFRKLKKKRLTNLSKIPKLTKLKKGN